MQIGARLSVTHTIWLRGGSEVEGRKKPEVRKMRTKRSFVAAAGPASGRQEG